MGTPFQAVNGTCSPKVLAARGAMHTQATQQLTKAAKGRLCFIIPTFCKKYVHIPECALPNHRRYPNTSRSSNGIFRASRDTLRGHCHTAACRKVIYRHRLKFEPFFRGQSISSQSGFSVSETAARASAAAALEHTAADAQTD